MVTHDPVMARLADRRIEMHHGRIASQELFSINDEEQFEEVLEEIWVLTEERGEPAEVDRMETNGALPISVAVERLEKLGLVTLRAHNGSQHEHKGVDDECHAPLHDAHVAKPEHGETIVEFTTRGRQRAADIVRRHRLAELLFAQSFGVTDNAQITTEACKFDHILSPEMTEKICEFLNHPATCPHGAPIPPGKCCAATARGARREVTAGV
jgi:DtxR family Mn-dependent transcriptional regulator